jgi:hypothetical protein
MLTNTQQRLAQELSAACGSNVQHQRGRQLQRTKRAAKTMAKVIGPIRREAAGSVHSDKLSISHSSLHRPLLVIRKRRDSEC